MWLPRGSRSGRLHTAASGCSLRSFGTRHNQLQERARVDRGTLEEQRLDRSSLDSRDERASEGQSDDEEANYGVDVAKGRRMLRGRDERSSRMKRVFIPMLVEWGQYGVAVMMSR